MSGDGGARIGDRPTSSDGDSAIAYGGRSAVEGVQRLVPDEAVEAVVAIQRRYLWTAYVTALLLTSLTYDALGVTSPLRYVGLVVAVFVAAAVVIAVQDVSTGLRLGGTGYVAVTATRVIVLSGGWFRPRPRAVIATHDRHELACRPQPVRAPFVTVSLPAARTRRAAVRVPSGLGAAQHAALALVTAEPGSRWSTDPDDLTTARLWTPSGWSSERTPPGVLAATAVVLARSAPPSSDQQA